MMKIDRSTLMMALMITLVVIVVGASQYQQFSLNSSNSVKLQQINNLLHNQTIDLLRELEHHTNATETNLHDTRINMYYIKDTNQILHEILLVEKNMTE